MTPSCWSVQAPAVVPAEPSSSAATSETAPAFTSETWAAIPERSPESPTVSFDPAEPASV